MQPAISANHSLISDAFKASCLPCIHVFSQSFSRRPRAANTSTRSAVLRLQSSVTPSIGLDFTEIWGATCFTWGSPSPLSLKQINKTHGALSSSRGISFLVVLDFPSRDTETTRINSKAQWRRKGVCSGPSYCSYSEALAMPFIHYEWSAAQAEKGETTRLWA